MRIREDDTLAALRSAVREAHGDDDGVAWLAADSFIFVLHGKRRVRRKDEHELSGVLSAHDE